MHYDSTESPDFSLAESGLGRKTELCNDTVLIPVHLCNLPSFYPVANQLLGLTSDPNMDAQRATSIAGADPALAAEVLFLANSSLFGFPARIRTLSHAVALLGLDRTKALAITVAMRAMTNKGGPSMRRCWRHSVATAAVSAQLSTFFECSEDAAYTAGLLHDIGRLGLLKSCAKELDRVLADCYTNAGEALWAERAAVQVDHGRAGAWLVQYWTLPESFGEVCEHHHDPADPHDSALLGAVKAGCRIAEALGYAGVRYVSSEQFKDVLESMPHIPAAALPDEEAVQDRIEAALDILDR